MGEVLGPLATIIAVVVAAWAGYWYRQREWLKERRYQAYGEFLAAFSNVVDTTLEAFTVHLQWGDVMWVDEGVREKVRPVLDRLAESRTAFGRATDDLVLVASEEAYVATMRVVEFVAATVLKLPPWTRGGEFTEPAEVRRLSGLHSGAFILAASADLGAKAKGRRASGLAPEGMTPLDAPDS